MIDHASTCSKTVVAAPVAGFELLCESGLFNCLGRHVGLGVDWMSRHFIDHQETLVLVVFVDHLIVVGGAYLRLLPCRRLGYRRLHPRLSGSWQIFCLVCRFIDGFLHANGGALFIEYKVVH